MNTKSLFFFCFLCAFLLISAVATQPSKDDTKEESETRAGLDDWGRDGGGGPGGGWGHDGGGPGGGGGHHGGGPGGDGGHHGGCGCCGQFGCRCC
ncbi:hypothetical protein VNO80_05945 [Phaseolus coccineus]|uniref:Glycine-rich protein n=1 Tax=Phaseolus coccineus TaxID=3886 RepID=A0AAN9NKT1_PHACN